MSQGPSIRDLRAIVESFNRAVEEADTMPDGSPVPDSLMVDIEDTEAWKNRNKPRNDFEPKTNICPDCEGTGDRLTGSDHAFPGLGYECERCNGEGAVFENIDDDDPIYSTPCPDCKGEWDQFDDEVCPTCDNSGEVFESINEAASRKDFRLVANLISKIEDPVVRVSSAEDHATMFALQNPRFDKDKFMAACNANDLGVDELSEDDDSEWREDDEEDDWDAERYNKKNAEVEKFKGRKILVTDLYDGDVYGYLGNKRFMISSPLDRGWGVGHVSDSEIEISDPDFSLSDKEEAFLRAWHSSLVNEDSKPYATMKDGPDKYLFRKDQKQKLVGSADNEPENGEEELEESLKTCPDCNGEGVIDGADPMDPADDEWCNTCNGKGEVYSSGGDSYAVNEEENMDKFIREMQIAAGIVVEDEAIEEETVEEETVDEEVVEEEVVDEGKLPDALKKHQFGKKDDDKEEADDKEEVDEEEVIEESGRYEDEGWEGQVVTITGGQYRGSTGEVADVLIYHSEEGVKKAEFTINLHSGEQITLYPGEFSQDQLEVLGGIGEDCDSPSIEPDGGCSPFTHADDNVDMVREDDLAKALGRPDVPSPDLSKLDYETCPECGVEGGHDEGCGELAKLYQEDAMGEDLLLAPQDEAGPEVDEDDMVYGKEGKGKSYGPEDFDKFAGGEPELDRQTDFNAPPRDDGDDYDDDPRALESANDNWGIGDNVVTTWEEPNKYSVPLRVTGVFGDQVKVTDDYGNTELMFPEDLRLAPSNESLGEEPNDDERIIDVGDAEDYEKYDFDDEFEQMLGGSSDMPGAEYNGMYEMNDLRRLAGLEQLAEEECDEEEKCDEDKEDLDEIAPVVAAVARGAGAALADKAVDSLSGGDVEEDVAAGAPITDDLVAYEIADEKAYYVIADVLGAELDFGPQDEILVPLSRNDQVLVALDQQGFEKEIDFRVAGEQYEADLQNGYNDRAFSDGQDYFPRGSHQSPSDDLGPTASGYGDNAMDNRMRSKDTDEVYESMKLAYRRHRKS